MLILHDQVTNRETLNDFFNSKLSPLEVDALTEVLSHFYPIS